MCRNLKVLKIFIYLCYFQFGVLKKNIIKLGFYLSEIKIFWFIKNYFKIDV